MLHLPKRITYAIVVRESKSRPHNDQAPPDQMRNGISDILKLGLRLRGNHRQGILVIDERNDPLQQEALILVDHVYQVLFQMGFNQHWHICFQDWLYHAVGLHWCCWRLGGACFVNGLGFWCLVELELEAVEVVDGDGEGF